MKNQWLNLPDPPKVKAWHKNFVSDLQANLKFLEKSNLMGKTRQGSQDKSSSNLVHSGELALSFPVSYPPAIRSLRRKVLFSRGQIH